LTIGSSGAYTFTPNANYNGTVPVATYSMTDGSSGDTSTLAITVTPINDGPIAIGTSNTGTEDAPYIAVTIEGSDIDGTVSSFRLTTLPLNGALYRDAALTQLVIIGADIPAVGNSAQLYFKPAENFNSDVGGGGAAPSFNFTAVDNLGAISAQATETINITQGNDGPPVAATDSFQTLVGTPITFTRAQLLSNDTLNDYATLTSTGALPAGLTYDSGTQTYTYNPGAAGSSSFTYTLTDQDGQTNTTTVNLSAYNSRDDLATVYESGLTNGTGGGTSTVSGTLFGNDTSLSGAITSINGVTPVGGFVTITDAYGTLVVNTSVASSGAYTYTLNSSVDNDSAAGATPADFVRTYNYVRTGGNANLQITIKDDAPTAENSVTEVATVPLPSYEVCMMLDVSGSMTNPNASGDQRLVDANGNATVVSAAGSNLGTSTLAQAKAAMKELVSKYFDESNNVSIRLGIFSTSAQSDGVSYTSKATALAAIDALQNLTGGTNYQAGLTTMKDTMWGAIANPNDGKSRISYFLTDGTPSGGDTTDPASDTASGYRTFAANNKIQSYALGIGPAVDVNLLAPLNGIHNVDADRSDLEAGAVNNGKDAAIIVTDLGTLTSVLQATVPQAFGGSVSGGGTSVKFGADGGYIQYIDLLLDSADAGTEPDTTVRFTYDPSTGQISNNNNTIAGGTITSTILNIGSSQGFTKGTLVFDFTTGDYTYIPQGSAVEGQEINIGFGVIDNDGDTASATNTIRFIDGKPQAFNDFDTLTPSTGTAASKFFEGNVLNAVGTDGGGAQVTGFRTGASGEDETLGVADVTQIVFKGATFDLTTVGSGTAAGGNWAVNAGGELTWTSSTEPANVMTFHRDGYYKYTPPAAQTGTPPQNATTTASFVNSATDATNKGITLGAYSRTANLNNTPNSTVTFNASGAGVNGGSGNNRVDNLENFSIVFNRAQHPQGVQNVVISVNAANSGLGNNGSGAVATLQYSIYDIAGNLLGQFASTAEGNVTIPTGYGCIGKILIQPNSTNSGSTVGSATIAGVSFNHVNVAGTASIPDETIQYTITDKDVVNPDSSTASLTLRVVTNEYVGTSGSETVTGSSSNDLISGLAGDDTLNGLAGNDIIRGGDGNDTIDGGADNDQLYGGMGNDTIDGGTGDDLVYGEAGNDTLAGNDGNDTLYGGAGTDIIRGGLGADTISGGAGNDTLYGNTAALTDATTDTFKWELADKGSIGAPAADTIVGFDNASKTAGGDVLDLRDLLSGESHTGNDPGNLANYLHFEKSGTDTIIHVSNAGQFAAGFSAAKDVQTITLQGVDVVTGFANDQQIVADLLLKQKLITD
ncbi:MAG: type I secretion C-terminal target domain-containing protein, partial [Rhodoferax sp.]